MTGIEKGSDHGYPEFDSLGFVVHHVGDPTKPIIYSFYVIRDLHIGDLGNDQEDPNNPYADYNKTGWRRDLDLSGNPPVGMPNKDGMANPNNHYPGGWANWYIDLVNEEYDFGAGNGRFCVVLGDLSVRAEVSEQQHAKLKLDSLDCPWVPVIGNHDTWPKALSDQINDDGWFHVVHALTFIHAEDAFPNWIKAHLTASGDHCPN